MLRSRNGWLLAAALITLLATNAFAAGELMVGVNGGIMKYTGDFGKGMKTGMQFGPTVEYVVMKDLAIGADFLWNSSKLEDDGKDASAFDPSLTGTLKDKFTLVGYGAHAKYFFPLQNSKVQPFVSAGAALYNGKRKVEATGFSAEEKTKTKVGGHGGLGAMVMATEKLGIGVQADYHIINTDVKSTKFYDVLLGLSYRFPTAP